MDEERYGDVKEFVQEATRRFGEVTRNRNRGWSIDMRREVEDFYGFDLSFSIRASTRRAEKVEVAYDGETVLELRYWSQFDDPEVEKAEGEWEEEFRELMDEAVFEEYGG